MADQVVITHESSVKSSPRSLLGPNGHLILSLFLFSLGLSHTVSFLLCSTVYIPGLCNTLAPLREWDGQALFRPYRAL